MRTRLLRTSLALTVCGCLVLSACGRRSSPSSEAGSVPVASAMSTDSAGPDPAPPQAMAVATAEQLTGQVVTPVAGR